MQGHLSLVGGTFRRSCSHDLKRPRGTVTMRFSTRLFRSRTAVAVTRERPAVPAGSQVPQRTPESPNPTDAADAAWPRELVGISVGAWQHCGFTMQGEPKSCFFVIEAHTAGQIMLASTAPSGPAYWVQARRPGRKLPSRRQHRHGLVRRDRQTDHGVIEPGGYDWSALQLSAPAFIGDSLPRDCERATVARYPDPTPCVSRRSSV